MEWKFQALSSATDEAVICLDRRGRISSWNRAAENLFGYSHSEARGQGFDQLMVPGQAARVAQNGHRCSRGSGRCMQLVARHKTGKEFPVQVAIHHRQDDEDSLLIVRNATVGEPAPGPWAEGRQQGDELARQREALEAAFAQRQQRDDRLIWQLMHHDPLTGLPNRLLIRERIYEAMIQAAQQGHGVGVLAIGVEQFERISETLGPAIADFLVNAAAASIAGCVGSSDIVARLGGNEFAVVLAGLPGGAHAETTSDALLAAISEPIAVAGHELVRSASIGIAYFPDDGADPDALLGFAQAAMYHARGENGSHRQRYSPELNAGALERLNLEEDLRRALERNELELHYQPQIDLASGRIEGAEALLRWRRPGHGLVSPVHFIPLAEETGLIVPIGEWVLKTACAQLKAWQAAGAEALRMAVNLSTRQFSQDNLVQTVQESLRQTEIPPESLELEITESMLMHNLQAGSGILHELRRQGVLLAIDDFGTGYSSLNYLKRLPVDRLKLDQSFVRGIPADGSDIAQAVIALGHSLKLKVVAEGVENEAQHAFLCEHGCDSAQGYIFSPPVDARQFAALLAAEPPPPTPPVVA